MSADSLYDDIRRFLKLTARVTSKVGNHVNVGEKFKLKFTGSNTAYAANLVGRPRIVFKNPRIFVQGTDFAKPAKGAGWHDLPDNLLFPGEASSVTLDFEATDDLSFWEGDLFLQEQVARAWILADLDQDRFFQIWNVINVHHEIEET